MVQLTTLNRAVNKAVNKGGGPSYILNYLKSDQPMSSYYKEVYDYLVRLKYPL